MTDNSKNVLDTRKIVFTSTRTFDLIFKEISLKD